MDTWFTIRKACSMALLLAAGSTLACLAEGAQPVRPARAVIQVDRVEEALRAGKMSLEGAEVRLLAENTSSVEEPRLEVRSVEPWGERAARVRLDCVAHEQCLPFYVGVTWADAASAKAALRTNAKGTTPPTRASVPAQRQAETATSSTEIRPGQRDLAARPRVSLTERALTERPGAERGFDAKVEEVAIEQIHAGAHATLVLDGERLHIKVPVICLEAGAAGRRIRVTAVDHKQTYFAEVVDGTLLKGTL